MALVQGTVMLRGRIQDLCRRRRLVFFGGYRPIPLKNY
jgi:hypothetical protein